jgi:serine/threonine protein kinase
MDQISCGYKYLLTNNIVHRDIKPANILKVDNTWKIADFGFAVRKCMTFTSPLNVGTPLYMPIEALVRN